MLSHIRNGEEGHLFYLCPDNKTPLVILQFPLHYKMYLWKPPSIHEDDHHLHLQMVRLTHEPSFRVPGLQLEFLLLSQFEIQVGPRVPDVERILYKHEPLLLMLSVLSLKKFKRATTRRMIPQPPNYKSMHPAGISRWSTRGVRTRYSSEYWPNQTQESRR